jgi:hypothetical protein
VLVAVRLCGEPACMDETHLCAMCPRCHWRSAGPRYRARARISRAQRRGQLWLPGLEPMGAPLLVWPHWAEGPRSHPKSGSVVRGLPDS